MIAACPRCKGLFEAVGSATECLQCAALCELLSASDLLVAWVAKYEAVHGSGPDNGAGDALTAISEKSRLAAEALRAS